jgi:hypothetical protein
MFMLLFRIGAKGFLTKSSLSSGKCMKMITQIGCCASLSDAALTLSIAFPHAPPLPLGGDRFFSLPDLHMNGESKGEKNWRTSPTSLIDYDGWRFPGTSNGLFRSFNASAY